MSLAIILEDTILLFIEFNQVIHRDRSSGDTDLHILVHQFFSFISLNMSDLQQNDGTERRKRVI
jgi:hypothetical protein